MIQSLGLVADFINICLFILIIILLLVGLATLISGLRNKQASLVAVGLIIIASLVAIAYCYIFFMPVIPSGSLGIDDKGNWYESGQHFTFNKVEIVPLKGATSLWNKNLSLQYDLTPEEVISLESGAHFQERLRSMYAYSIDENWNAEMIKTSSVPRGFNASHLKIVISV